MPSPASRRDFLTGRAAAAQLQARASEVAGKLRTPPAAGHTLRLSQRAMACDFSVILNAGLPMDCIEVASAALDLISALEAQLSVYRPESELTLLNQQAGQGPVRVEPQLYQLLRQAAELHRQTGGAFDATSGPLVALWRACREEDRIPSQEEIQQRLKGTGMEHVVFDDEGESIQLREGVELNLGGIGKGYALDRAASQLSADGLNEWLLHGGHSSLLARGPHDGLPGWPVGIGNPLFRGKRLGTLLLCDCAMATSGANVQFFRHQGKKYGHILDPRTGWPVESLLSVTVLAPTAAEADALSTAFYVMGVEKAAECCDNLGLGAILIPLPKGPRLEPVVVGIPDAFLYLDADQLAGASTPSPPSPPSEADH